jgi:hypothetical protein
MLSQVTAEGAGNLYATRRIRRRRGCGRGHRAGSRSGDSRLHLRSVLHDEAQRHGQWGCRSADRSWRRMVDSSGPRRVCRTAQRSASPCWLRMKVSQTCNPASVHKPLQVLKLRHEPRGNDGRLVLGLWSLRRRVRPNAPINRRHPSKTTGGLHDRIEARVEGVGDRLHGGADRYRPESVRADGQARALPVASIGHRG